MSVYVSETNHVVTDESAWDLRNSLPKLGSGVSRTVYDLGDGTVLKLQTGRFGGAGGNLEEWETWQRVKDSEFAHCFAECIAIGTDGAWMIQRAISEIFGFDQKSEWYEWWKTQGCEAAYFANVGDIHPNNCGYDRNGNVLIIDYAWSGFMDVSSVVMTDCSCCYPERSETPEPCACGEHECSECFPSGDPCGPLEGCNERDCEQCGPGTRNYHTAIAYVLSLACCARCYVSPIHWDLAVRNAKLEQGGQLHMFSLMFDHELVTYHAELDQ